jgi:neutral ceramidase
MELLMGDLKVGCAKIALEPKIGTDLVGYSQKQVTQGIHDPIHARALVCDDGQTIVALCSIEVCLFTAHDVAQMREVVASKTSIPPENIFFCATHTHSAPAFWQPENWERSPSASAVNALVTAYQTRQPARIGFGFGQLQGYSINRRFMNRPVDPSIGVIRVDTEAGKPLALMGNFGNHAVVMGYDNQYVSGDWCGYSSTRLESEFDDNFVALFSQGGAGDVNPLTETVRQRMAAGHPVEAIGSTSTMYGVYDENDSHSWNIGDRGGGTFTEAETIAIAYNHEVLRVWRSIKTASTANLWVKSITVNAAPADDEEPIPDTAQLRTMREFLKPLMGDLSDNQLKIEVMLVGIGDAVLVGQPGETFSENAVSLRKACQQMGIAYPMLVSYANGWFSYLTPANAYAEGGYEVVVAQSVGLSRFIQERIWDAILPHMQSHAKP